MKNRILELEKLIEKHKNLYYAGNAEISDEQFDSLENELRKLDPQNTILDKVGSTLIKKNEKIKHKTKMLSLEKTYSYDDLLAWINKQEVLSMLKFDGSSCSLIYEDGKLVMAKTRGDGDWGENIFNKCEFMQSIPKKLKKNINVEIRGEIICYENQFTLLTDEMEKLGLNKPSSQRNIVAGILGRKENIQISKYLNFISFELIADDISFFLEEEKLKYLSSIGFEIPDFQKIEREEKVKGIIEAFKEKLNQGDVLIDGLVFILNDTKLHRELGETSHHPKYKIAFKVPGESKNTKINSIEWNVSRNGILTPVAIIEPIELSGAVISRVTLHNFGLVKNFNLKKGDEIEVIRSGEVIPKFLSLKKSSSNSCTWPKECPGCFSRLVEEDIKLKCINTACPEKKLQSILHFVKEVGIEDVSDKRLKEMIEKKILSSISDIYKINKNELLLMDKVKEKLANKIMDEIEKSKKISLVTFLSALGIEGVSSVKLEKIINNGFDDLNKILTLTKEKLISIEGFAEKSANDFYNSIHEKEQLIKDLISLGVEVIYTNQKVSNLLGGKKICITGELSIKRELMEEKIKSHGGIIVSSVSKNTAILLTNETDSGSTKYQKAKQFKIDIISEEDFKKIIGE
jgi:DNA ligase (NAD+)